MITFNQPSSVDWFRQVEFGRANGHFNVPNPGPDHELSEGGEMDSKRLYKFVQKITTDYRAWLRADESSLNDDRVRRLSEIGFPFSTRPEKTVPEVDWATRVQQLEAFQQETNHLRVDPCYDKYNNLGMICSVQVSEAVPVSICTSCAKLCCPFSTGGWAVEVSERHRAWQEGREYLAPDMIEKFNQLSAMGFTFDIFPNKRGARSWEDSFACLLEYQARHGSLNVPHHYKADYRLGSWVAVQRKDYKLFIAGKPSRMTHERAERLNGIGFEWVRRERAI